jgi:hypothetical protein
MYYPRIVWKICSKTGAAGFNCWVGIEVFISNDIPFLMILYQLAPYLHAF